MAYGWVLALTSLASMMVALDALIVSTALPTLRADLGASVSQLEWTVDAYVLTLAVLLMTAAALGDRFGRRRMFVTGLGAFSLASAACALAPSADCLIAARVLQGAGAALMLPLALALLTTTVRPGRLGSALGVFAAVTGLGVVLGPLLGGVAIQEASWRWIFWLNVPIGLVAVVLSRRHLTESLGPDSSLDIPGLALVTAAAFGLVWGLVRGNSQGWTSAEVTLALSGGVALTAGFVVHEVRTPRPMLPMSLFRSRWFSAGNATIFCLWAAAFSAIFFMAQFLQIALRYDPLTAGLGLMPWGAAAFVAAPVTGRKLSEKGERPFMVAGMLLVSAAAVWLAVVADPKTSYWEVGVPLLVAGLGASVALPAAQSAAVSHIRPADVGKASGAFSTLRQLGGALGIALAVAAFTGSGGYGSPREFSSGFAAAMTVAAGLALVGALAGALAPTLPLAECAP